MNFLIKYIEKDKENIISLTTIFIVIGAIIRFKFFGMNLYPMILLTVISFLTIILSHQTKLHFLSIIIFLSLVGFLSASIRLESIQDKKIHTSYNEIKVEGIVSEIIYGNNKNTIVIDTQNKGKIQFSFPRDLKIHIGNKISFIGNIFPLPNPPYPGGYDFSEVALYKGIIALGTYKSDIQIIPDNVNNFSIFISNIRLKINNILIENIQNPNSAGVAMSMLTGNNRYIDETTKTAIQKSGISHLLAISGLHVSIISLFTFVFLRKLMALSEWLSSHFNTKKIAAIITIIVSFFHLHISGLPISATRSFIMFTIALIAILIDRKPTSMRIVMTTLGIVVITKPESVFSPSLQMSFAAVIGLISVFRYISKLKMKEIEKKLYLKSSFFKKMLLYFFGIIGASFVATLSTSIFSIYHFNQYSNIGIISNLIAVPITQFIIIPMGFLGVLTDRLYIGKLCIKIVEISLDYLIEFAKFCASTKHAAINIRSISDVSILIAVFGILLLLLMEERWRFSGLCFIIIGIITHNFSQSPFFILHKGNKYAILRREKKYYLIGNIDQYAYSIVHKKLGSPNIEQISYDIGHKQGMINKSKNYTVYKFKELNISVINLWTDNIRNVCEYVENHHLNNMIINLGSSIITKKYKCNNNTIILDKKTFGKFDILVI